MTNHEIALELLKLVLHDVMKYYEPGKQEGTGGYDEFIAGAFATILSNLPPQDVCKNQSESA